jgi:uncharacterized membrane protein
MAPFIVLITSFAIFRVLGWIGVSALNAWQPALRVALACMFLVTASAHWMRGRADLVRMVPPSFSRPELLVTITGVLEVAGAIGLLIPATARAAAWCLAALMVSMFPANAYAARRGLTIRGRKAMPLPLRAALQALFVGSAVAAGW